MKGAIALLLAAIPVWAQVDAPKDQLDALNAQLRGFKQRLAPVKIDRASVDTLFDRIAKDPESNFTKSSPPAADGSVEILSVSLNEVDGPPEKGADMGGGFAVRDLIYRRYFTHMEAVSQKITPAKNGRTSIDEWKYIIGLDGSLSIVTHNVMIGKMKAADQLEVDKAKSKSYRMSPSDPSVRSRWQKMQEQLLKMGRTVQA
ncbi:MAG: hypothetical protein HY077_07435 [Elusimicrobia bacterium]|nr:hypothetical protein [Elusimicrobiota bacterium]